MSWLDNFSVRATRQERTLLGVLLIAVLIVLFIFTLFPERNEAEVEPFVDNNTYLNEEVVFAEEIYIKCVGINATKIEDDYQLNLRIMVEQWHTDINVNQQEINPSMFELRLVDINSPSSMDSFLGNLVKATLITAGTLAVTGEVNVLEQTFEMAADYALERAEMAASNPNEVIELNDNSFEEFAPYLLNGEPTYLDISFDVPQDFVLTNKTLVLSIDVWDRAQRDIYLVLRPFQYPYSVEFDLSGGSVYSQLDSIEVSPGKVVQVPLIKPTKVGYEFLYWVREEDNISTKVRDLYFVPESENQVITLYAHYIEKIDLENVVNLDELITIRDYYNFEINYVDYKTDIVIKIKNGDEVLMTAPEDKKFLELGVQLSIDEEGDTYNINNDNIFFIENKYIGYDISSYYGFNNSKSIENIRDFNWYGENVSPGETMMFKLYFEVDSDFNHMRDLNVLEVDLFLGINNAKSILIR